MNGIILIEKIINPILMLMILLIPLAIFADTNDNDWCKESVDLSDILPPIYKDQNDLGSCYAFTATTLIENYACKQSRTSPCETLSVMDAIAQYQVNDPLSNDPYDPYVDTYNRGGGFSDELLEILRNNGICSATLAPYNNVFQDNSSAKANWNLLENYYNHIHYHDVNGLCTNQEIDKVIGWISHVLSFIEYDSSVMDYSRIPGAVIMPNVREYLKAILVPEKCIQNRKIYNFEIMKHSEEDYPSSTEWGFELKRSISANERDAQPNVANKLLGMHFLFLLADF